MGENTRCLSLIKREGNRNIFTVRRNKKASLPLGCVITWSLSRVAPRGPLIITYGATFVYCPDGPGGRSLPQTGALPFTGVY